MVELEVKVIKKYKEWLKGVQPFLARLTEEGYRYKETKVFMWLKGIEIYDKNTSYIGTIAYGDWSDDSYYWDGGIHYSKYLNYKADAKKKLMYRICVWLHRKGNTSEYEKNQFETLIKVLDSTPNWKPDFEYQFKL